MNLKAKVGLDTTGFDAGLKRMKAQAGNFMAQTSKRMQGGAGVGGALGGAMKGGLLGMAIASARELFGVAAKAFPTETAARIRDESKKIGVDTDTFQELDYAARQSGASIEDVGKAFKALALRQQDAIRGNKEYSEAFERYGVTVEQLKAKGPQDLFKLIAEQVEDGVNKANELADIQRLLGRSGTELLPTMQAGLGAAMGEAQRIGAPMSAKVVRDYAKMADDLTKLGQVGMRAAYGGRELIDVLPGASTKDFVAGLSKAVDWATKEDAKDQLEALNAIKANTAPLNRP